MKIVMLARTPRWYRFQNDKAALRLMADGHEVAAIVVQTTSTLGSFREWIKKLGLRVVLSKIADRVRGLISGASTSPQGTENHAIKSYNGPVAHFKSHNGDDCIAYIRKLSPDVLVLRGCGILRGPVLNTARIGVINPHYAVLPGYRGMDVTEWSILHGESCAVSVHWVTEGVDSGETVISELLPTDNAESLGDMRERCAALSRDLLAEALGMISREQLVPSDADETVGRQYFVMHPRLHALAEKRLKLIA